jgi:uncharacterized membrane protein YdbT with pleckstrin-like domain
MRESGGADMSYIAGSLLPNEKIIYQTELHWIIFVRPALWLCFGVYLMLSSAALWITLGVLSFLWAIVSAISALIRFGTTEIAITNKRLILKYGFIARNVFDVMLPKVETVNAEQGIFGRMFDYGTLRTVGSGGTAAITHDVARPMAFRQAFHQQISA